MQENICLLHKVVKILHHLKMGRYADYFTDEGVSGAILVECTVDTLEKDLHVTSSLHRIKLMLLISGKQSAYSLLHC